MKFPLNDIELNIADPALELAENLISSQKIRQFQEIERNLWVALIEDGQTYEVEVQISPSKVKAYTCDCDIIKQSGICPHVVSILLLLRQKINARKEKAKKAAETTKVKVPNRITTTTILDLVKPNELKAFIKKYASQDRTFTLLLKAQFAHIVPGHEEKEHISKVLEHTIKSVRRPGKPFNNSGIKLIQKVANTILQQSDEALYKKHFADVFDSLSAIILQVVPLLSAANNDPSFSKIIHKSYELLTKLYKAKIPPQLDNEIWTFLCTEFQRPAYYLYKIWSEMLELGLLMANSQSRQQEFNHLIETLESEHFAQKNADVRSALLSTRMSILNLQGNQVAIEFFLKHNMNDKEVLLNALNQSVRNEDWNKLRQLATYGIEQQIFDKSPQQLHEYLLLVAIEKKEKRNIEKYAQLCFLDTYDFNHLTTLKQFAGKKWLRLRDKLLQEMLEKPYSIENRNAIAKIYADENLDRELLEFIQSSKSLDLLRTYDQQLKQSYADQLPDIYKQLIFNYLNNYIGRPAAIKIRQSIDHLLAQEQTKLAQKLVKAIRSEYSDRNALMEALGHF